MILHTVIVSFQRLELLKRTIASYQATITVPHHMLVVDNGSDDDVLEWLTGNLPTRNLLFLGENRYPGPATNRGFELASSTATHLHRSDNDMEYLGGWCENVQAAFAAGVNLEPKKKDLPLGIMGLRTTEEELGAPHNTGGTAVRTKEVWDKGLRYTPKPWRELGGMTEDYWLCRDAIRMGYGWGRVTRPSVVHLASGDWNDPYYAESYGIRGIIRE